MYILAQSHKFFQLKILSNIKRKNRKLFSFGFNALTLNTFISLNSNARMVLAKKCTAETKIFRVVANAKILSYFPHLLSSLQLIKSGDHINVDFSTFGGFQILTFAKQTYLGRAIPVYIAAITYPIENPGSQTQFIIKETKAFVKLLGVPVHLVFDRGFELPYLASSLAQNHISFTIRMRKDKHIDYRGKDIPLRNLPWFEIEETFKDIKHIFTLNRFYQIKKKQTFLVLLWFYILGFWIMWLLNSTKKYLQARLKQNIHKRLSVTKFFFEQTYLIKNLPFCLSP